MRRTLVLLASIVLVSCAEDRRSPDGGATLDAGAADAGAALDAATPDGGPRDAGPGDAGSSDAGTVDAGTPDAGTPDAGLPDAGLPDAGLPDAGPPDAGPPDPSVCPVGVADGCCPLGLRYGGVDEDCEPLDCAVATLTDPIVLEAPGPVAYGGEGTAGISWTGRELVIGWAAIKDASAPTSADLWVQRRDSATGALVRGPDFHIGVSSGRFAWGQADLAWAPAMDRSLFVSHAPLAPYGGVILDGADEPLANPTFGASCNGFHQPLQVVDTGDRFFVAQMTESCAAPTNPTLHVTPVSYDGVAGTPIRQASISRLGLASAFDPVGRRILMLWKESTGARARFLDVDTLALGPPFSIPGTASLDQIRAAFDGERFGILYSRYAGGTFTTSFLPYDPDGVMTGTPTVLSMPSGRRYAQGRIAWTGDGWAILITTVASSGTSTAPGANDDPELWLWRLRPDGTVRESRQLDAAHTGVRFPGIAYAGGRVALTWTRTVSGAGSQHVLAFLSCAE